MKVAILTFYYNNYNFGGQLQARALARAVEHYTNNKAEQLRYDYTKSWLQLPYWKRFTFSIKEAFSSGINNGLSFLLNRIKAESKKKKHKSIVNNTNLDLNNRMTAFKSFSEQTPHSEQIYNNDTIGDSVLLYDAFICGGDQIWNDWSDWFLYNALDNYCLAFVPDSSIKFSYAPSVPLQNVRKKFFKRLINNINKLNAISVREISSVKLLQSYTAKKMITVVDPVLLLTAEDWEKEEIKTDNSNYVLCYLLGDDLENRNAAKNVAKNLNKDLLTFPHIINTNMMDIGFGTIQDTSSGPGEFISLIHNADLVITDSFHACVFCVIYHKPFFVVERKTQVSGGSMKSRIVDFLNEFQLNNQMIRGIDLSKVHNIPQIDYSKTDELINEKRAEAIEFLKTNLSL